MEVWIVCEGMNRRELLKVGVAGVASALVGVSAGGSESRRRKPNVVFVFADQWRAQATGYAGDPNARTPHLDRLAKRSTNLVNAVSCCPVCSPYRASLLTGQYPSTHGVFLNDVLLRNEATSLAEVYRQAGYETAYIGKWHLDGNHRSAFIPRERRQGFGFWKVLDCTHAYNNSFYYGDEDVKLKWEGYDAIAQTREAEQYIRSHAGGPPFLLVLSWGPPHDPYDTAPPQYRALFQPENIALRPNVPEQDPNSARRAACGYYAHIAALDDCVGDLLETIRQAGIERDTIFVFTSDHGDLLYSHGQRNKQQPYDESIRVPFLLSYPVLLGENSKVVDTPINAPDIMPTLLGLSGIPIPKSVEGTDFSGVLMGKSPAQDRAALIACYAPFGQWTKARGGREYRGVRTRRYAYVRSLDGPWLLYDNEQDPHQQDNLCNRPEHGALQEKMETLLSERLRQTNDTFLPAADYIEKWGYEVDESGTVRYTN